MKQLFQEYRTGAFRIEEVPMPAARPGHVVVRTEASAVSVGTERNTVDLARKSLVGKALARPDLVRQVLAKVRTEGLGVAWRASMARLEVPVALGYSSAGIVVEVGPGVDGVRVGDRVACSGSGHAGHAEFVSVPAHLAVLVPTEVGPEEASMATLGSIALHAARLARAHRDEPVLVIGLGLLGQITVQILAAWGCRVFAVDVSADRVELARRHGAEEGSVSSAGGRLADRVRAWAGGDGCRAAVILAATPSNEPLELAAEACGEKGRVVAAGLVGLTVPRAPFFEKELELVVSRAWGSGSLPGQPASAAKPGEPTAHETLSEFLALVAKRAVRLDEIITHRFPFEKAAEAYGMIMGQREPFMGVLLTYGDTASSAPTVPLAPSRSAAPGALRVGVVGAGAFARGVILPALRAVPDVALAGLATHHPVEARKVAESFGFSYSAADAERVMDDPDVDAVFVLTRHSSHAALAARALAAGKHVFLEKPLATTPAGLEAVRAAYARAAEGAGPPTLLVGFNRRFAPATRFLLEAFGPAPGPLAVHCTVNAGGVPRNSWINDAEGGGRIIGEACHFVDLVQTITRSLPVEVHATALGEVSKGEDFHLALRMADGSIGSILYTARGTASHPRERVEVIGDGAVGVIDNFAAARFVRGTQRRRTRPSIGVDRGHAAEIRAFVAAARALEPAPVPFHEHVATTLATFAAVESLRSGAPVAVRGVA